MSDPLGLIGSLGAINRPGPVAPTRSPAGIPGAAGEGASPNFKEMLQQQIDKVNQLQNDANTAMEDLVTGQRDDVEGVITATQKADLAFKMLIQVHNKVMDAYEEVKQIRI